MAQETIDLAHAFYDDDEYSRQLPRKKDYVSIQKGVHKQKRLVLCNLHELFVAFKKETQMWKLDSPSFVFSALNFVSFQVHQEHTWYLSVPLIEAPFC